eukprot:3901690-Rhodomonas_salina.2
MAKRKERARVTVTMMHSSPYPLSPLPPCLLLCSSPPSLCRSDRVAACAEQHSHSTRHCAARDGRLEVPVAGRGPCWRGPARTRLSRH